MSTYTPTHCPDTGRKFTKAERKAANKAKYALERSTSKPTSKPKSKRKGKAQKVKSNPATVAVPTKAKLMRMTKAQLVGIIVGSEAPASEPAAPKRKPTQQVRKPRRNSNDGIEQSQARKNTAKSVGKALKTKVVHAITEGEAQPLEPRKEITVEERKAVKREQMRVTLLPGETPEEGIRRVRIQQAQAEAEASLLEAEALLSE